MACFEGFGAGDGAGFVAYVDEWMFAGGGVAGTEAFVVWAVVVFLGTDFDYSWWLRKEVAEGPDFESELNWELWKERELPLIPFGDFLLADSA